MNKFTLKDSLKKQPFKPFIIKISEDQEFKIDDSDMIGLSPVRPIAVIFTQDGHYYMIDTDKIISLEFQ